ncbi:uncharacterized protein LOC127640876 isoform X2 [Xyrauchen texanus]|uniref:uncharacterized protein LOC127640876 isoform X2 n=1 Tax=Xyrauchen texanus TaxID=154827 RepID=UPI0022423A2B|nr:uncharacterized protein LOC127640876 isoform X2 [Xyrauchen texanus]
MTVGLFHLGVFGVDTGEMKIVSVMEGDSVTLHTNLTEILGNDQIVWAFSVKSSDTRVAEIYKQDIEIYDSNKTFGDRLQLDRQTGSLTIRNIQITNSGLYKLTVFSKRGIAYRSFSVTVYARLPIPVIIRDSSQCSSSSECVLVCSVVNVTHVTLSWYKGNSLLSSISVSDLNSSLSLPLEVEYQENNIYSCVVSNSFTNLTKHLNITEVCQTCPERHSLGIFVALVILIVAAAVGGIHFYRKKKPRPLGVLGVDEEEERDRVSVMEGESLQLPSDVTQIKRKDHIIWWFANQNTLNNKILLAEINAAVVNQIHHDEPFRDRLQLDYKTGSLLIKNISIKNSGVYLLQIVCPVSKVKSTEYHVTVYARLPIPVIIRDSSQCSSSSKCVLVCSVVNVTHVTLSWYKGNSLLSSISVSDLNSSLSLPLEVEYQENNIYSCVVSNSFTNLTKHLNITEVCQPCENPRPLLYLLALIPAVLAAIGGICLYLIYGKQRKVGSCCRTSTSSSLSSIVSSLP